MDVSTGERWRGSRRPAGDVLLLIRYRNPSPQSAFLKATSGFVFFPFIRDIQYERCSGFNTSIYLRLTIPGRVAIRPNQAINSCNICSLIRPTRSNFFTSGTYLLAFPWSDKDRFDRYSLLSVNETSNLELKINRNFESFSKNSGVSFRKSPASFSFFVKKCCSHFLSIFTPTKNLRQNALSFA